MTSVLFQTKNSAFEFDLAEVKKRLNQYISEHNVEEAIQILGLISSSSDDPIKIPEEYDYFGYIALDLISKGKGSVTCKTCNKTYQPDQLKSITVGHGKSPFSINLKQQKGGIIKRLFGKRQKLPGMFGGKGYECPQGHELITMITWRT